MSLRALELFSGVGGFHFAMKESGLDCVVVAAVDINTTANAVYRHNFSNTLLQRNIESFTPEELDRFELDLIWMSPPCQPFTRVGKKEDCRDSRSISFLHVLRIIPRMKFKPKYILMENVKGFETSFVHDGMLDMLKECGYYWQEFLLSPTQFGIPNSRLRYYLCAQLKTLQFCFKISSEVLSVFPYVKIEVPTCNDNSSTDLSNCSESTHIVNAKASEPQVLSLSAFLEKKEPEYFEQYLLSPTVLNRYSAILDIVDETSTRSCCFTKAYGHYVEGTGSVFHSNLNSRVSEVYNSIHGMTSDDPCQLQSLQSLRLRFFTPREIGNLMGFPPEFDFPHQLSTMQKYRLLGNSLNVHVVTHLLKLCLAHNMPP